MEVILSVKDNKSYLKVKDRNRVRTTNNLNNINHYLHNFNTDFTRCVIKENDMYLYSPEGVIILNKYMKNIRNNEFGYIINSVDSDIPVFNRGSVKLKVIPLVLAATTFILVKTNFKKNDTIEQEPVEVVDYSPTYQTEVDNIEYIPMYEPVIFEPEIEKETNKFVSTFAVNSHDEYTQNLIDSFIASKKFESFLKYADEFNLDPYLLLALATSETSLNHNDTLPGCMLYNGCATGIMQIENTNIGSTVSTTNKKGEVESIKITNENVLDFDTNVKIGSIMFKNCLDKYKGNIYLTIQSYNYGVGMMDSIISMYAKEINSTSEDVMNNYSDLGWLKYVEDVHNNPNKYINSWKYPTYGCSVYIENVLGNYIGNEIVNEGMIKA